MFNNEIQPFEIDTVFAHFNTEKTNQITFGQFETGFRRAGIIS